MRIDRRDYDHWMRASPPVILVMYDAGRDEAYWLYVQADQQPPGDKAVAGRSVTLRVPTANVLNEAAVRRLERYNQAVLAQQRGTVHHHA